MPDSRADCAAADRNSGGTLKLMSTSPLMPTPYTRVKTTPSAACRNPRAPQRSHDNDDVVLALDLNHLNHLYRPNDLYRDEWSSTNVTLLFRTLPSTPSTSTSTTRHPLTATRHLTGQTTIDAHGVISPTHMRRLNDPNLFTAPTAREVNVARWQPHHRPPIAAVTVRPSAYAACPSNNPRRLL